MMASATIDDLAAWCAALRAGGRPSSRDRSGACQWKERGRSRYLCCRSENSATECAPCVGALTAALAFRRRVRHIADLLQRDFCPYSEPRQLAAARGSLVYCRARYRLDGSSI